MHTELLPGIDWVGFVDWNIRDFHSYNTERGATYNAYLIRDQKTVLIDTVKKAAADTLLKNVQQLTDLDKIDYLICNHAEQDHAGAMAQVVPMLPNAEVVCTAKCREILSGYTDTSSWKFRIVANGETISLGENTLTFIHTPMVHWPDSMFTYVGEKKLLFSMDGFGQHIASSERFDDELPLDVLMEEAKIYYANIVYPYGAQVTRVLQAAAGLEIEMIAPSHGVIWRKNLGAILEAYQRWAAKTAKKKVVIFYDTMWESTEIMAKAVYEGVLSVPGVACEMHHVRKSTLTEISTAAMDAKCCALGSATLNTLPTPTMAAVMTYLQGLRFPIQYGLAFGSFGWGKGAVEEISAWFEKMQWTPAAEGIRCKWRPAPEVLALCEEGGRQLALKALED
ncbi:MAG: FprA family A-type flavoprotein [Thermoguttaceae bacterium]|nr:FprA family A-type flavoprotein [Planctomycetaceae bacterium]MBQ4142764.1 FprA family A-type flavoprotein [Thermoguttaceae bacterium]